MKNFITTALIFLLVLTNCFAQQEKGIIGYDNWLDSWTEFKPSHTDYGEPTQILSGKISKDTKLLKRDVYLLLGDVFVTDSATLTIEPGTRILADYDTKASLIVTKGSKLLAKGTQTDPIVFTSNRDTKKAGDWGGIFLLGDAPINTYGQLASLNYGLKPSSTEHIAYGGNNTESDSGILKYVRIEFAGKRTKKFGYFNALTLAGVGNQTVIENVMVSYGAGNSYNVLGGSVILEKLVSYRSKINDYEFNFGTQCQLINSLAIRSPYVSSANGSRCMVIKSYDNKEESDTSKRETFVNAENLTLVNVSDDIKTDMSMGLVQEAIFVGPDVSFAINKSVVSGFYPAVILDDNIKLNNENLEKIQFTKTYFNNCKGNIYKKGYTNNDDLESWYGSRAFSNLYAKGSDKETFIAANDNKNPDFRLQVNRIIASNDFITDDDED
ncbi:hypothetical protein [Winogradskyella aquimaris]|uniref:T9SS C-terminal target domain-containing protein n=1 Tax=Winogradskyella aquimaris TaxID=864074 RepID=A0ABU5EKN0_9FLAO|nr:hypothetical protein [Winogradskyella aquimaris]MDY2586582.1 hypothetical protein [Winogradskyella aquimaris]